MDEKQKQIIGECLNAVALGRFFPDWEFSTLFGLERSEVAQIAADWPNVDFRDDKVNSAINNSFVNLLGYPIDRPAEWSRFISASQAELAIAFQDWLSQRIMGRYCSTNQREQIGRGG